MNSDEHSHKDASDPIASAGAPNTTTRREFLRTSIYAAYATPLITALLVEEANAAPSCTAQMQARCDAINCARRWCRRLCNC